MCINICRSCTDGTFFRAKVWEQAHTHTWNVQYKNGNACINFTMDERNMICYEKDSMIKNEWKDLPYRTIRNKIKIEQYNFKGRGQKAVYRLILCQKALQ